MEKIFLNFMEITWFFANLFHQRAARLLAMKTLFNRYAGNALDRSVSFARKVIAYLSRF
jgi:hypothetical protein